MVSFWFARGHERMAYGDNEEERALLSGQLLACLCQLRVTGRDKLESGRRFFVGQDLRPELVDVASSYRKAEGTWKSSFFFFSVFCIDS